MQTDSIGQWSEAQLARYVQTQVGRNKPVGPKALTLQKLSVPGFNPITMSELNNGPPNSPSHGDIWIATQVASLVGGDGTTWQFIYDAYSTSPYKWNFIGGPRVGNANGNLLSSQGNNAWSTMTGGAPTLTVPRSGDWIGVLQAQWFSPGNPNLHYVSLGSAGAPWGLASQLGTGAASAPNAPVHNEGYGVGIAAGTVIQPLSFSASVTSQLSIAFLSLLPIRVS